MAGYMKLDQLRRCMPSCARCSCASSAMAAFRGVWTQQFWRAVFGELLAMTLFVLLSLGSTIGWGSPTNATTSSSGESSTPAPHPPDLVLISLCFGLAIATLVQCFGHISGAHINPAVTIAMVALRKMSLAKAVFYVVAQCLGAMIGAGILYAVTPTAVRGGLGVTKVNPSMSVGSGLLVELLITFQLLFTICATCDPKREDLKGSAALAIGLSVCTGHLFAIPYTGASMNPARSFGPAVVTSCWENHWVYWVGPVLGGLLAGSMYEYLLCPDSKLKQRYSQIFSRGRLPSFPNDPLVETESIQNGSSSSFRSGEKQQKKQPPPSFTVLDVERAERLERRGGGGGGGEREAPGADVLSSV
ncbi:aquaporin-4-like isoform X2 [Engraulis encrasicolus]|uniref:aquaporin-4-like isoform X2 n=1 Tax=Engraulis encrasicolus TaxID=184585 RepID=UPI002FCEC23C